MILSVIALVIQLLPGILSSFGVISPDLSSLIAKLAAALPGLFTALSQKQPVPAEIVTILQGIQTELQILQANTSIDPTALADATTLDTALTEALAAYETAQKTDDPSLLTPLPEDVANAPVPAPGPAPVLAESDTTATKTE